MKGEELHVWQHSWFVQRSLTAVSGRLQTVFGDGAPAHGEDVPGVKAAPVIERPPSSPSNITNTSSPLHPRRWWPGQIRYGFFLSTASSFNPGLEAVLGRPQRLLMGSQSVSVTKPLYVICVNEFSLGGGPAPFERSGRRYFCSIKGPQEKHGPRRGVHPESWENKEERRDYYPWFCSISNISQSKRRETGKTGSWRQAK